MTIANGFAVLQVLNSLNMPIRWIPQFIGTLLSFTVSMRRIQRFLVCDEVNPHIVDANNKDLQNKGIDVLVENANFSWGGLKDEDKKKKKGAEEKKGSKSPTKKEERKSDQHTRINSDKDSEDESLDQSQTSTSDSDNEEKKVANVADSIQIKDLNLEVQRGEFI